MDTKKSTDANVENLRFPILLLGLLFTGSLVLASFSYQTKLDKEIAYKNSDAMTEITFLEEKVEPEQPEEPQIEDEIILPPDDNIKIDSNTQKEPVVKIVITPPDIKKGPDIVIEEDKIIEIPDLDAVFPGGAAAMQSWINSNVQYPEASIELNEQGKVWLSFVVEKDGSISNIKVVREVSPDLDKEAKRLVRKMPKWEAGEVEGAKVRTRCRLPINFILN